MKRRLLALLAVGIVLISMTWLASNPSPQRRPPTTHGPVLLGVTRKIRSANELTAVQRDGLVRRLAMTSVTALSELTNIYLIQVTNRGPGTVEMWGYDSASPVYGIYVEGTNGLERLERDMAERVPAMVYLGPAQTCPSR